MSINRSSLNTKRRYRLVIALFQILPVAAIIVAITKGRIVMPELTQDAIAATIKKNGWSIAYRIGGIIGYYLVILGIRKIIIYIGFGNISDETSKKNEKQITPIKKSFLEKQRRYRIVKVVFIILPIAIILIMFIKGKINIPVITKKNILDVIENNIRNVGSIIIGYVLYIGIISSIRKLILYVGRGGMIDDMKKFPKLLTDRTARYATTTPQQQKDNGGRIIFLLIMIMLIIGASYNQSGSYKKYYNNKITTPSSQCIPTNCGHDRRSYCTNRCYPTQSACMEAGRGICSNNMCRQCP